MIGVSTTSFGAGLFADLPGVVLDVRRVADLLRKRGFEMRIVGPEPSPSVDDVTTALSMLVEDTQPGDLVVIFLAGHGYRTPDDARDEADGWDETFVCGDGALRDDWFRDGLWSRARAGARFVVVVDACHSDTATIALDPEQPPPAPIERRGRDFHRLVLAACRDEQKTRELVDKDKAGGIVTTAMLEALHRDPEVTYADLWSRVAEELQTRDQFPQEPHLSSSGPDDTLLHSMAFVAR